MPAFSFDMGMFIFTTGLFREGITSLLSSRECLCR